MRYRTIVEIITDADNEDEAIDKAGEYLRGGYNFDVPLRVRTYQMNRRNYRALGYTIATCLVICVLSFSWFYAGSTYQKIASTKRKVMETFAIQPPLRTDINQKAGKSFKKSWDKIYKEKVLYSPDKNVTSK